MGEPEPFRHSKCTDNDVRSWRTMDDALNENKLLTAMILKPDVCHAVTLCKVENGEYIFKDSSPEKSWRHIPTAHSPAAQPYEDEFRIHRVLFGLNILY